MSARSPQISLITLGVADLERSFCFYKDALGLLGSRRLIRSRAVGGLCFARSALLPGAAQPAERPNYKLTARPLDQDIARAAARTPACQHDYGSAAFKVRMASHPPAHSITAASAR